MGKRLLLNLLLAVMVAGLGALAWMKSNEEPVGTAMAVSALSPDMVTEIELSRPDFPDLEFTRHNDRWYLAGDPGFPADNFQIATLTQLLEASSERYYPAANLDLLPMGLAPAKARIQYRDAVSGEHTFEIGGTDPIDKFRYVSDGKTVFLLEDRYQHFINAGAYNFIERQLIPDGSVITGLQLPAIDLSLGEDNHWQLMPENPAIAAADIRALIARWLQVQALYVTDSNEEDPAGDQVRITLGDIAEPVEFVITSREPDLVLTRPDYGIRYHITGETAASLLDLTESETGEL